MEQEHQDPEEEQRLPGWLWFVIFLFLAAVVWGVDAFMGWLRSAP